MEAVKKLPKFELKTEEVNTECLEFNSHNQTRGFQNSTDIIVRAQRRNETVALPRKKRQNHSILIVADSENNVLRTMRLRYVVLLFQTSLIFSQ